MAINEMLEISEVTGVTEGVPTIELPLSKCFIVCTMMSGEMV